MENQVKTIISLLEEFLDKMTIAGSVEYVNGDGDCVFSIKTKESGILIGEDGKHLIALNHLVKKMAENRFKQENLEKLAFFLDVNNYQIKKIEEVKNMARMNAQRVRFFKKEIEMDPMSSYDRRIVHAVLGEYPDIKTESVGDEPYRRVVIRPLA
ncbi:MAG: hypothetical protein L6Q29_02630 [Candidatus Pacebacteria bacterium]|nr:hypothetical protein [Candidatus Paceibacterota bacterium]NUQ56908.1 hypothetical protein [Candidatus Paceibacter sp.]